MESFPVGFVHGLLHLQPERCLELHSVRNTVEKWPNLK